MIPLILNRLQNESYRISALKFIYEVSTHLDISQINFSDSLSYIYDEIASFMRKSHRTLLILSLQTLLALLKRYNAIQEPLKMVNELRPLLEGIDTQLFNLALSAVTDVLRLSKSSALVSETIQSNHVPKIINSIETQPHVLNLETLKSFWAAFSANNSSIMAFCLEALDKTGTDEKYTKMVLDLM